MQFQSFALTLTKALCVVLFILLLASFPVCVQSLKSPLIVVNNGGVRSWVILHGMLHHIKPQEIEALKKSRGVKTVFISYDVRVNIPIGEPWFAVTNESVVPVSGNDYYAGIGNGLYPRSQSKEDIWMYENAFYGVRNGIFLESGALDGLLYSNSFFFEYYVGWKAIHIGNSLPIYSLPISNYHFFLLEADVQNFQKLALNRKKSTNINAALCNNETEMHYISKPSQGAVNGIYEFMSEDLKKIFHLDILNNPSLLSSYPTVMCKSPKNLFSMLGIRRGGFYDIDIWVLDVEGAELEVLKGVDFNLVTIKYIAMECDGNGETERDRAKIEFLAEVGYKCTFVERNCMCAHKSFVPSKK